MSGIQTAQVVNANIYLNGKNLLGRAAEVKLPEVTAAMKEHSALGLVGKFELPAGFEKMEGEIVWNSFYADALKLQGDIFPPIRSSAGLPGNCGAARAAPGKRRLSPS